MGWFHKTELDEIQSLIELGKTKQAQAKLKSRFKSRFSKKELGEILNNLGINLENFLDFQRGTEFELQRKNSEKALKSIKAAKKSLKKLKSNINHLVKIEKILED